MIFSLLIKEDKEKKVKEGYWKLLKEIEKAEKDNLPNKNYNFSLDSFDENGEIKKES